MDKAMEDAIRAERVIGTVIGEEQVREAVKTLNEYKNGKAFFDQRVVEDERWYRLRHWECMRKSKNDEVEPTSAWLYNCIIQKHADMMDNFPQANILPREESDKEEAKRLTKIVPVILDQCDFEDKYDEGCMDFLKYGAAVYGIFWDASKLNGLGDIDVRNISLLNIYTQPGIKDLQKSRNVFTVELVDNDLLEQQYPQLRGKLSSPDVTPSQFVHDESISTSGKSSVVDWYYKKQVGTKTVLHFCKFCNGVVLYATENERNPITAADGTVIAPAPAEAGLYDDGEYPFEIIPFNETEGSPYGFGMIDVGKSSQEWIDRGNAAVMKSMMANAKPRYLVRQDCDINEDDFRDTNKEIIRYSGASPTDAAVPVQTAPVPPIYVQVLQYKVDELKEVTGNRDVATGGAAAGVTAASAIAAMQEAASKGSRTINKKQYRGFRNIILKVIERIRQFYDIPRQFRIVGETGAMEFVNYSNAQLRGQYLAGEYGAPGSYRLPVLDVSVSASKASPYSKMSQNELALQLYQQGFFAPANADSALLALEMMDFSEKDELIQKVQQNSVLYQMLMAQMQMMAPPGGSAGSGKDVKTDEINALGGDEKRTGEPSVVKKARQRTAEEAAPR